MNDTDIAHRVLKEEVVGDKVGLLTTASGNGQPHATWMATYAFVDQNQIITLTSPDSLKAENIARNHRVEWLFTSSDFQYLIYLIGKAYIEHDPAQFKNHWKLLPDKGRAYFLESYNSPPGFAMIRTEVDTAIFSIPIEGKVVELDVAEVLRND